MKKLLCTVFACVLGFFAVAAPLQASASEGTVAANDSRVGVRYTCTECGTSFVLLQEMGDGESTDCVVCGGTAVEDEKPGDGVMINPITDKDTENE